MQAFLESVETLLKDRKKEITQPQARVDETSVAKFFEEIKVLVRDVPDRVAGELGANPRMRQVRKRRRFHPMMFEEILHLFRESDNAGLPVLLIFSMLRDDFPWLYELGIQLYRSIEEGNPRGIDRARMTIMNAIEMTHQGPFLRELMGGPDDDEMMMGLHHLGRMLDRIIPEPKRRRKPDTQPDEKKS